jgi:membrane protease YdiL (CAAX protease family)
MINTPYKQLEKGDKPERHPALQLIIFIGIFAGIFFIGSLIGMGIVAALFGSKTLMALGTLTVTTPHFVSALWILQVVSTTIPILVAPVIFSLLLTNEPIDYIKPSFRFPWLLLVVIFALMFLSNPLIEFLSNINQKMVLPQWLKWMRESEDSSQKAMEALLKMDNIWDMIMDVLLVGLLTAIAEEFMFRGVIQTIFVRWTKNTHAAVWITAILFSAFHMEFFGFLPRLLLGVFFGYFVAWSGSVWTGVWAHFINNGTIVIVIYLFQKKIITGDPNNQHLFNNTWYVLSFAIVVFLLFIYKRIIVIKDKIPAY